MTDFSVEHRPITFVFDALVPINTGQVELDDHLADLDNPHEVTAVQAGADPAGSAAAVQSNLVTHENSPDVHNIDAITDLDLSLLTPTEKEDLTDGGDSILHYHSADRSSSSSLRAPDGDPDPALEIDINGNTSVLYNLSVEGSVSHKAERTVNYDPDIILPTDNMVIYDSSSGSLSPLLPNPASVLGLTVQVYHDAGSTGDFKVEFGTQIDHMTPPVELNKGATAVLKATSEGWKKISVSDLSYLDIYRFHDLERVINNVDDLPAPVDLGGNIGITYLLSGYLYSQGNNLTLDYPITLVEAGWRGNGATLSYTGAGALLRNNASYPFIGSIKDVTLVGSGTNQAFAVTAGAAVNLDSVTFRAFEMGFVSGSNGFFATKSGFRQQKGKLLLSNIAGRISLIDFGLVTPVPINDSLIEITGSPTVFVQNALIQPSGGDSAFKIDAGFTGTFGLANSEVSGNEIAFNSVGLDQRDPHVHSFGSPAVPDSQTIGSFQMESNTINTAITEKGADGVITAFADAGGGQLTVTSAGHGLSNGEVLVIVGTLYNGTYVISNVATDAFEITETFLGTEAAGWETGWVKVAGVTVPMENERASQTADNQLTFTNLEQKSVSVLGVVSPKNSTIAAAKSWQFSVQKNGARVQGSKSSIQLVNIINNITLSATDSAINGDVFELFARNMSDSSTQLLVVGLTVIIK